MPKFITGFQHAWIAPINPDGTYGDKQAIPTLQPSLYQITPRPPDPTMEEIRASFAEMESEVSQACAHFINNGVEPFLEFEYGDDGLVKKVTVRARREDDPL